MDIIGRDETIEFLWKQLVSNNGLVLSANRRMGKTTIIQEMHRTAGSQGYKATFYKDLEAVRSSQEFANSVHDEIMKLRGKPHQLASGSSNVFDKLFGDGGGIGSLRFGSRKQEKDWKEILEKDFEFLAKEKSPAILFLDEFPIMLSNVIRDQSEEAAMEILDKLRAIRQTHKEKIKIVFTGSIGIHLILERLKRAKYTNQPINDMAIVEVGPLEIAYAESLAEQLLTAEGLTISDEDLSLLVRQVDHIPFYISQLVSEVVAEKNARKPDAILDECLSKSLGHWNLVHFANRISEYYDKPTFAYKIIDHMAQCETASIRDITEAAKLMGDINDNDVLDLIRSLCTDQYFVRNGDKVTFRFQIIRSWWRLHRKCD